MRKVEHIVTAQELWRQTAVALPPIPMPQMEYGMGVMTLGSCFSDHIGGYLASRGFSVIVNPFGALYNPISVSQVLERLLQGRSFDAHEMIEYDGLWHSSMHHGEYSATTVSEALCRINGSYQKASLGLSKCKYLLLTWGSAYVYEDKSTNQVVSNCHKRPEANFVRKRKGVEELLQVVEPTLSKLLEQNAGMQIISTISPIRHMRDGAHGNQVSKATLMLMNEALGERLPRYHYFPAYELMMDQMRDYRFYADDLCHPAPQAIAVIAQTFGRWMIAPHSQSLAEQVARLHKQWMHRPLHPEHPRHIHDRLILREAIQELMHKYPDLDLSHWFADHSN